VQAKLLILSKFISFQARLPAQFSCGLLLLCFCTGAAEIYFIPDDSVMNVALQTFLAVPLLLVAPGASVVGATILNKIKD